MTAPPDTPRLDADALAVLHGLDPDGRHGTVARILRTYEATLPKQLAQLAAERDSAKQVEFWAHTMKSSSRAIGALAFADACEDVLHRLRVGDTSRQDADVMWLLDSGARALQAVRSMLHA